MKCHSVTQTYFIAGIVTATRSVLAAVAVPLHRISLHSLTNTRTPHFCADPDGTNSVAARNSLLVYCGSLQIHYYFLGFVVGG